MHVGRKVVGGLVMVAEAGGMVELKEIISLMEQSIQITPTMSTSVRLIGTMCQE